MSEKANFNTFSYTDPSNSLKMAYSCLLMGSWLFSYNLSYKDKHQRFQVINISRISSKEGLYLVIRWI